MATKEATTARAIPSMDDGPFIGGIEVVKVIREHVPIKGGGSGTFGAYIDEYLYECAKRHEEVRSVSLEINEDHWHALSAQMRGDSEPVREY